MPEYKLSMIVEALDRASGPLKSAGGAVDTFGATVAKMAGMFGLTLGLAAAVQGIKQFTMESIGAFSDLRESASKMQAVFKTATPTITEFAQNSARDLGMSKQAAYEATSTFGNLFTSMGMGVAPAAAMSTGLVKLATDLSSFNNISPEEALIRLRSGIVGEVEPLRTLGINIDAVTVKNKAMAMGLADLSGALSYAALIEARYALILEQSVNAQGDRAKTSGELAGSERTQAAAMQDLKAAWGAFSAPTYTSFLQTMTSNVEALTAALLKQQYVLPEGETSLLQKIISETTKPDDSLQRSLGTLSQQYADLQATMAAVRSSGGAISPAMTTEATRLAAEIAKVQNALLMLASPAVDAERAYTMAMSKMAAAVGGLSPAAAQAAADAKTLGAALESLRGKEAGANVNAVAAGILAGKLTEAQAAAWGLAGSLAFLNGQGGAPDMGAYWNQASGNQPTMTLEGLQSWGKSAEQIQTDYIQGVKDETEKARLAGVKAANDLADANEKAAQDTQAAWDKAFDAVANSAKSEFSKAQDQLKGLLPGMNLGGENAPGSNGPFENIFRAADVAARGAASPWAAKLGLTQEAAKQIVSDFAAGLRTPEVRALIDEAMLIDQVKSAQMAADSLTAWGNEIAAKAGVSTGLAAGNKAVTAALFGNAVTGKDTAGTQTTSYGAAAKDMLGGFAGALQTQVVDKALGNELRDVGAKTFGIFEAGVIDAAGKSTGLRAVIYAMVAAATAAQGATQAGRASGVN